MKNQTTTWIYLLLCGLFFQIAALNAQSTTTNETCIETVKMGTDALILELKKNYRHANVEIVGPDYFYFKKEYNDLQELVIESKGLEGKVFKDGRYKVQITPVFKLSRSDEKALRDLSTLNELVLLDETKESLQIPLQIQVYNSTFSIKNEQFVLPRQENYGLKLPTDKSNSMANLSSIKLKANQARPTFTSLLNQPKPTFVDIVHDDDVIISSSLCIGSDCENGEAFGFDTQRFRENNLRIHFDDTSSPGGSFPYNDWRIEINSNLNGGSNHFAIQDVSNNRTPFKIEATAPSNSLYVNDDGNMGIGTNAPVLNLQIKEGNSPSIRLEQDGSSGFSTQTFDIVANESQFFIRDVTNGSTTPFNLRPGAPSNAFFISNEGKIGIGFYGLSIPTPEQELHVNGNVAISGAVFGVSDRRLKKEIVTIAHGLNTIQKLRPTTYFYKAETYADMNLPSERQYGFIAQELEEVLPNLVTNSDNPDQNKNFKRVSYTGVIPILVKGMQEQQTMIETQQEELAELKKQVALLTELISKK